MRWLSGRRRTPIGIDIGGRYIKAAQLSRTRNGWRVEAAASFPRTGQQAGIDRRQVRHVRDVLFRQGFTGKNVVVAVPRQSLMTGILELPPRASGAPLDEIARVEFARVHKCRPESVELAYWDLPRTARANEATHVMAAACSHASAGTILDAFEQEGLEVLALDIHAWAVARACKPVLGSESGITGVLDIGWGSAQLVLLRRDVVIYERAIGDAGLQPLSAALGKRLELDSESLDLLLLEIGARSDSDGQSKEGQAFDDIRSMISSHLDRIVEELQASFSYAVHRYPDAAVERVLLLGGGASIPGAAEHLASALSTEVRAVAPTDLVDCPGPLLEQYRDPTLTVSIGLAQFADG